ncbi:methionine biosynthesis protein MetW [Pseudovibrio sp. Tun.PSC04-5.I4]|uniref:methionine biosynthesis protein MetW n=1 Tax=Pseudovibrio sp. Tun.PSC04-5.I4 TaxID=1798213 RepID=UPI00088118DC|nr:methionine biosynthesis protein MetW [Pseudovibrio sp. Tun.PSC04-5.I4]SDR28041.1 methionine biosynthesis protein MetW [Pseudovibrio sp. Tun.PSC04-5.I4]
MTKSDLKNVRGDHRILCDFVTPGARVLDIGCGTGKLLELLIETRGVDGRGFDTAQQGVNEAVSRGLSVVQGDADTDLEAYPDDAFDYAILSHTLQATMDPKQVLEQLLRIGKRVVVSFPNFGHWRNRMQLLFKGRMPVTDYLPYQWYDTPNIHFCTIRDFVELSKEVDAKVIQAEALDARGQRISFKAPWWVWNLIGDQAVFLLERK